MLYHNDQMILGVDLGNYNMKTANVCFPSAYLELAGDGSDYQHTLFYTGKHYALGGPRVVQQEDKDTSEDFLILTQFAIARELEANRLPPGSYDMVLAVTLPPAFLNIPQKRQRMKRFFRREFSFRYNGSWYKINITRVYVCPQATAALYANVLTDEMRQWAAAHLIDPSAARPLDLLQREPSAILVDIGGGTVDVVVLQHGAPQPFDNDFPAKGVIWTYGAIRQEAKAKLGMELSEEVINMFLHGEPVRIGEDAAQIIWGKVSQYAQRLLMTLREKQLPISTAYVLLMGGGACLVRNAWYQMESTFAKLDFLGEIKAIAMGSEVMTKRTLELQEQRSKSRVI